MKTYQQTESGFVIGRLHIPTDPRNRHYAQMLREVEAGEAEIVPASTPEETPEALKAAIVRETQGRLDAFAQTRNYDGILSAASYSDSTAPTFAAEGKRAVALRDATWSTLYAILDEVQAGTRTPPEGFADIEPELPELTWEPAP